LALLLSYFTVYVLCCFRPSTLTIGVDSNGKTEAVDPTLGQAYCFPVFLIFFHTVYAKITRNLLYISNNLLPIPT